MADKPTLNVYDTQAEHYRALVTRQPDKKLLQPFIDACGTSGRILDLGCGIGDSAAEMARQGLEVEAVDGSESMIEIAAEYAAQHPTMSAYKMEFQDLSVEHKYRGIWANFSLLHIQKAEFPKMLKQIALALCSDGIFGFALKLGTGERRDRLGRFYAYYSEDELETYLEQAGFLILHRTKGKGKGMAGTVDPFIGLLCQKENR